MIARRKAYKHAVKMVIVMAAVVASRIRILPFVALQFVSVAIQETLRPVRVGHVLFPRRMIVDFMLVEQPIALRIARIMETAIGRKRLIATPRVISVPI